MKANKKTYLYSFLIALALTLLTAFSVTSAVRRTAEAALRLITDESLIETLQPLRFIRFRVSFLPTAIGAGVVSLPVYRIFRTNRIASRIGWIAVIAFLLLIIWIVSLFTLHIGLASLIRILFILLSMT